LYETKNTGRNNYRFYSQMTMPSNYFSMEKAMRDALKNDEFSVYFQPVFNTSRLALRGAEALVRWHHAEKGMVSPAEFIPIAEESDLIVLIDRWVLRQACHQMARWHERGYSDIRIGVNLSMKQFQQQDLLAFIREVLKES